MENFYDVICIGAGSVGVPTTYFLSKKGLKVLCLESKPSAGQGQNKAAIGGIRATHSDPAKIKLCQRSLDIISKWEDETKDYISWKKGGYCFPVFGEREEKILKSILPIQKEYKLNIDWVDKETIKHVIPGINDEGLIGGTYSPDDGQASPLLTINSFVNQSVKLGAKFKFNEEVIDIEYKNDEVKKVKTTKGTYEAKIFINTSGAKATKVCKMVGIDIPVLPDSHEAGISAPVKEFLAPLVVDLRPGVEGKTANFYFAQNREGQIIFCYTPLEIFSGENRESTSEFMPVIARRLVSLIPRLKNILIRRIWRGLYPMTPDGSAIVGKAANFKNFYLGVGMCGQGFMLGPGVGESLANFIVEGKPIIEENIFELLSPSRNFYAKKELLK